MITRFAVSLLSFLLASFGLISECPAANSSGECNVTVTVSGGTLPTGWSYQLQYFDTDSNWYNGASGTTTQTYYKRLFRRKCGYKGLLRRRGAAVAS